MARKKRSSEKSGTKTKELDLKVELNKAYRAADKRYDEDMRPILDKVKAARAQAKARRNAAVAEAEAVYYAGIARLRQVK